MEHGQVRAILGRHAHGGAAPARSDPTLLVPASQLRNQLLARDEPAQRALAHDYVALWARTFRTLARHLRGRPERALALFAEEVYPFLRGDRLASRIERLGRHEARVLLPDDLPAAYHCGLLEAFVGLSGATAVARSDGKGVHTVQFRVAPADRLARSTQTAAALRLPLLAAAALAALTGIVLAWDAAAPDLSPGRALVVLVGAVAAQAGASALVDLRVIRRPGGPTRPALPARNVLLAQAILATTVAVVAGSWLATTRPIVLLFAGAGLVAGLLLPRLLGHGFGPLAAVLLYGPLIGLGAFHAFGVGHLHLEHALLGIVTLPLAFLAGAWLFLGDLADRPLDEAGGRRTLAVTLPRKPQAFLYAGLLAGAVATLAVSALVIRSPTFATMAVVLAVPAVVLSVRVARSLDDPHDLAPARAGTFAVLALTGLAVVYALALGGSP